MWKPCFVPCVRRMAQAMNCEKTIVAQLAYKAAFTNDSREA